MNGEVGIPTGCELTKKDGLHEAIAALFFSYFFFLWISWRNCWKAQCFFIFFLQTYHRGASDECMRSKFFSPKQAREYGGFFWALEKDGVDSEVLVTQHTVIVIMGKMDMSTGFEGEADGN